MVKRETRSWWITATICVAASALSVGAAAQRATAYRQDEQHAGGIAARALLPMAPAWRHAPLAAGRANASAVSDGQHVFFVSKDRVYAVDAESGGLKWMFPSDRRRPLTSALKGTPGVGDGLVYVGASDGLLYALEISGPNAGAFRWTFRAQGGIVGHITVKAGTVYFGCSDNRVYAVDAETGEPKWRQQSQLGDVVQGGVTLSDTLAYVIGEDQTLYALNLATGVVRWKVPVFGVNTGLTPVLNSGLIFVNVASSTNAYHAETGRLVWSRPVEAEGVGEPAVVSNRVFVVDREAHLHAFDVQGRSLWRSKPFTSNTITAAPLAFEDAVVVPTARGDVYALDTEKGDIRWSANIAPLTGALNAAGPDVCASPTFTNGSLLVITADGSCTAFRADAPDNTGPEVREVRPQRMEVLSGTATLRIEARVTDDLSGLNTRTLRLLIDNVEVPSEYDIKDRLLRHPQRDDVTGEKKAPLPANVSPMSEGRHQITVIAEDWYGNKTTYSWGYVVSTTTGK